MNAPDWYEGWKHEAFHQLMDKQDLLWAQYGISGYPRWDYDVDVGTLIFSDEGVPKVIADIQVVGTTGSKDWMWGVRNSHLPDHVTQDLEKVWQFGLDNEIEELTTTYLEDGELNSLGWEMTAVAARVLDAVGAYRPQPEGKPGTVFFLIKSIRFAN